MFTNFPFFPQQASEQAASVDALYFFLLAVTGFLAFLFVSLRSERRAAAAQLANRT